VSIWYILTMLHKHARLRGRLCVAPLGLVPYCGAKIMVTLSNSSPPHSDRTMVDRGACPPWPILHIPLFLIPPPACGAVA